MEETKKQHLEFIQNIITRMNTNAFQIKGMAVVIVSVLLVVYAATNNVAFIFLSIVPAILFWLLDSYYLQQERKFRGVYNNVAGIENDVEIKPYEMPIQKFNGRQYCFCKVFFSKTIFGLYGIIIFILLSGGFIFSYLL
jgi:hypothetical protein